HADSPRGPPIPYRVSKDPNSTYKEPAMRATFRSESSLPIVARRTGPTVRPARGQLTRLQLHAERHVGHRVRVNVFTDGQCKRVAVRQVEAHAHRHRSRKVSKR